MPCSMSATNNAYVVQQQTVFTDSSGIAIWGSVGVLTGSTTNNLQLMVGFGSLFSLTILSIKCVCMLQVFCNGVPSQPSASIAFTNPSQADASGLVGWQETLYILAALSLPVLWSSTGGQFVVKSYAVVLAHLCVVVFNFTAWAPRLAFFVGFIEILLFACLVGAAVYGWADYNHAVFNGPDRFQGSLVLLVLILTVLTVGSMVVELFVVFIRRMRESEVWMKRVEES